LGINHLFYFLNRNRKRILSYHNVLPDAHFKNRLHEGVSHSESIFRRQIAYLASRFRFGTDLKDPRELTLTFDDGYRNQHAIAHPILMQFGIRAYFFCSLDLVKGVGPLLIDDLLLWLSYIEKGAYQIRLPGDAQPLTLTVQKDEDRLRCWKLLYPRIMENYAAVASALYDQFDRCHSFSGIRKRIEPTYYILRFTPILPHALATMKVYGHFIGTHGKSHAPLGLMDKTTLENELKACSSEVGSTYNTAVFCFPFGGTRDVTNHIGKFGFIHALSNINQPLSGQQSYNDFFIPRLALPNTADPAQIDFILSGAKHFLKYRRLLPKW
jgi:peptidoglycan/xylan/chitin deacetylase (PgdA/CDA1 family)